MNRLVLCHKLKKEAKGLEYLPFDTDLGQQIYEQISQEAWDQWMAYQTQLINEYRLNLAEPESQEFIFSCMQRFLFKEE